MVKTVGHDENENTKIEEFSGMSVKIVRKKVRKKRRKEEEKRKTG